MRATSAFVLLVFLLGACSSSTKTGSNAGDGGPNDGGQVTNGIGDGGSTDGGASDSAGEAGIASWINCDDTSDPTSCVCAVNIAHVGDSASCKAADYGARGYCCATTGYPIDNGASDCGCVTWGCSDNGSSCLCGEGTSAGTLTACSPGYAHYCLEGTGQFAICTGQNFACSAGDTEVSSCSVATATCDVGKDRVSSCRP